MKNMRSNKKKSSNQFVKGAVNVAARLTMCALFWKKATTADISAEFTRGVLDAKRQYPVNLLTVFLSGSIFQTTLLDRIVLIESY